MAAAKLDARKPQRTRRDPARREEEIVAAAALYFSDVGFDGSMRDLAARIGISHALLFRYFPSKDALIDRVYEQTFASRWDPSWDVILLDKKLDLASRLTRFYISYLRVVDDPVWVRTFIFGGLAGIDISQRYLQLVKRKVIAPVAKELMRASGVPETAAASEAALELSWGLHGEVFYLPIRRWIYGTKVTSDHAAFADLVVRKFISGAPASLRTIQR